MLGLLLDFAVSILAVAARFSISPSQTRVALGYIINSQQSFGWLVRQIAELENDMNSVERIIHYGKNLEQEPPHEIPGTKPKAPWPAEGRVEIKDVVLRYRPELSDVLRGLSMDVSLGEKIGIVGRTGAGKSSITTALYRLVELSAGSILIDGVDVSRIGLKDLRSAVAIIPQDPVRMTSILHDMVHLSTGNCSCYFQARCGPTWILSASSTTLGSGMLSNDHISWLTRRPKMRRRRDHRKLLVLADLPSIPLSRTRGTTCLLVSVRWFRWPGLW